MSSSPMGSQASADPILPSPPTKTTHLPACEGPSHYPSQSTGALEQREIHPHSLHLLKGDNPAGENWTERRANTVFNTETDPLTAGTQ